MSGWREFKTWLLQESKILSELLKTEASESDAKDFRIRQEKLQVSLSLKSRIKTRVKVKLCVLWRPCRL